MAWLNIADFFLNPDDSDIKIRVQTEEDQKCLEVPGHCFVLRRSSDIFKKFILSEDFKEGITKVLELKVQGDIADGISFLRYLYTRNLENFECDSYISLLQTAHLYDVKDLFELCEKLIRQRVTPYSVCKIYIAIEKVATEECLNDLLDLMMKSAFLIFENQLHISLNEETLKLLLKADQLNVLEERQTVTAILYWSKTRAIFENNIDRAYVKSKTAEFLPFVRWSFIENITEFSPWFNVNDGSDVVTGATEVERTPNSKVSLSRHCRVKHVTNDLILTNYVSLSQPEICTEYSVNREIFLVGFLLHIRSYGFTKEPIKRIEINVNSKAIEAFHMEETRLGELEETRIIQLEFDKPVLMKSVDFNRILISFPKEDPFADDVSGSAYESKSEDSRITMLTPDPDIVFTFSTKVIAIEELYYLPK